MGLTEGEGVLPTLYQQYIHLSKYSRWRDDLERRETWSETAERYFGFWEGRFPGLLEEDGAWLRRALLRVEAVPSMRCLMTAGPALETDEIAGYNCSYLVMNRVEAWDEMMYLLMCGVGAGFSVERQHVEKLPIVPNEVERVDERIVVADSKYGWAESLRRLVKGLYAGKHLTWDTSHVRPAGAVLKTFGGRASGPMPLEGLLRLVVKTFYDARGRRLTEKEVHSICCKIGDIVVVGGVRRSAMIALFSEHDADMMHAKSGTWSDAFPHFAMANNSAVYTRKPSPDQFFEMMMTLIRSNAGEPGIFNREAAQTQAARWGKRSADVEYGTNPCLTGDTLVATADGRGPVRFDELAADGRDVLVYTMNDEGDTRVRWMRNPRCTGYQREVLEVELDDGQRVRCTRNHQFHLRDGRTIRAQALVPGDSLNLLTRYQSSLQEVVGGAARDCDYWWVASGQRKNKIEHRLIAETVYGRVPPDHVVHHRDNDSLNNTPSNLEWMQKKAHDALHRERMLGALNPMRRPHDAAWWARYRTNMSKATAGRRNGRYSGFTDEQIREHALVLATMLGRRATCAEWRSYAREFGLPQSFAGNHRAGIGATTSLLAWAARKCGYPHERRRGQRAENHKVVAVRSAGCASVYNGTVDEFHNFYVGGAETKTRSGKPKQQFVNVENCGEILLRDRETCNLSEVIARPADTRAQLLRKIEAATVFGTLQSTLTNFKHLSPQWRRNCEEERLLGVSIAGVPDHSLLNGGRGRERLEHFLEEARELVIDVNARWADRLGINPTSAATCLKPSGNTSQLAACASPLKPHHARRYVRRTRGSKSDPVTRVLAEAGVPHADEAWHPETTVVFEWPMEAPANSKTRHDWRALDQLELWQSYHDHWCDHKPSVTINVRPDEWVQVAAWIWDHWDKMSGVAFLPDDDHSYVQAPYEEIGDEEWEALAARMPATVDWSRLRDLEIDDRTTGVRELACVAGACDL